MDRIAPPVEAAVDAAASNASRPRRRWSDGPNYPWSTATDEEWSVGAQWPAMVALLCDQITNGTNIIREELDRLIADGRLSRHDSSAIQRSAETMRRAGIAVQQIVRLGAGCVQPTGERVDLTQLARQAVQERQQELQRRPAEIRLDIRPAEVLLDAAVAVELMNAALDWALSFSNKIRLKIETAGPSEPVRLIVRGALPVRPELAASGTAERRRDRRMNDNFHWYLLRQLGACCKLRINRSSSAATESAVIEFSKTFNSSGGLASVELLPGGAAQSQLRNAWVLAIVRDRALRESVLKLMLRNGLEASSAENCEQARQLCASRKPKVLVFCDESMGVTQLRDELVHNRRGCALVQIIRGTPSFQAHGFSAFEFVKVGRSEVAKELIPALLFELAQQG